MICCDQCKLPTNKNWEEILLDGITRHFCSKPCLVKWLMEQVIIATGGKEEKTDEEATRKSFASEENKCLACGRPLPAGKAKFCGSNCEFIWGKHGREKDNNCVQCGTTLPARGAKFCGLDCKQAWEKTWLVANKAPCCDYCGKAFIAGSIRRRFCDQDCKHMYCSFGKGKKDVSGKWG